MSALSSRAGSAWDLTALLNAADPRASLAERQLWLVRLMEWLRRAPVEGLRESREAAVGAPGGRRVFLRRVRRAVR